MFSDQDINSHLSGTQTYFSYSIRSMERNYVGWNAPSHSSGTINIFYCILHSPTSSPGLALDSQSTPMAPRPLPLDSQSTPTGLPVHSYWTPTTPSGIQLGLNWDSTGSPLGVHLEFTWSSPGVHLESTGSPLEVQYFFLQVKEHLFSLSSSALFWAPFYFLLEVTLLKIYIFKVIANYGNII